MTARRCGAQLESRGIPVTVWLQPEGGAAAPLEGETGGFPATVFEQVNPAMGDRVRAFALAALGEVSGRHVWDLYAGIGETTAALVGGGRVGRERRVGPAGGGRGDAARVPRRSGMSGRVEQVLRRLRPPALVITNPPRTGMDQRVAAALERVAPSRIVYVSCDPATLARDLTRMPGFRLSAATAFDLFPQTAHVETVAVLDRAS